MAGLALRGIAKSFGAVPVLHGIDLDVADGEFMVFVGPSGCGKSTTLRVIAGLEASSAGTLSIGDREIQDVPAAKRGVAMVFQSYALYPHMSVRENLSFALKLAGHSRVEIDAAVTRAAQILQIEPLLERKPGALSGGQRQRVAIGRAIVRKPEVFLFDEPLSNLDAALRVQMRTELARLHRNLGTTMVYVTHDQVEAMTLGHRIAVFNGGRIEQCDTPLALYERPATRFVAGFIGSPAMNFLAATVRSPALAEVAGAEVSIAPSTASRPRTLVLGIRPEHLQLQGTADGVVATVDHVEHLGDQQLVHLVLGSGERLLARLPAEQTRPVPGQAVGLRLPQDRLHLFSAEPAGLRID